MRGVESVGGARKDVDQLLKTYDPRVRELAQKLRKLVKKTLPNAVETVKWGNPMYLLDGKNLSWIVGYKDHADLGSSSAQSWTRSCWRHEEGFVAATGKCAETHTVKYDQSTLALKSPGEE